MCNNANADNTQRNFQDFRKERREKASKAKTESRVNKMIHKMVEDGIPDQDIASYIKMVHTLEDDREYDSEYSVDS